MPGSRIGAEALRDAVIGTSSRRSKKRALSRGCARSGVFTRVSDASDEPGSLKPMWPVRADAEQLQVDTARRGDRAS